jgi:hypothetical protein
MLFILIFIVLTLALPLSVEIYRKGSDNIVSRSGKELAKTKPVSLVISVPGKLLVGLGNFAVGSIMLGITGVGLFAVWKLLSFFVSLFF